MDLIRIWCEINPLPRKIKADKMASLYDSAMNENTTSWSYREAYMVSNYFIIE